MIYTNLAAYTEGHAHAETILRNLQLTCKEAAAAINKDAYDSGEDFQTTERSVRRWRAALVADDSPSYQDVARPAQQWTPGVDIERDSAELRMEWKQVGEVPEPDDADILREMGLDPGHWTIVNMRYSKWQKTAGPPPTYYESRKYSARRVGPAATRLSTEDFATIVSVHQNDERSWPGDDEPPSPILMVPAGDTQVGKSDGGGTPALIERFSRITEEIADDIKRNYGRIPSIVLPWVGDCIEGNVAMGGKIISTLDLTITEQVMMYQRLLAYQVSTFAPLADKLLVPVVPGNHDEPTRAYITQRDDSWAIAGAKNVDTMLHFQRTDYDHVEFIYPDPGEASIAVNVNTASNPLVLGFTHGHLVKSPDRIKSWWANQAHGRQVLGDVDILVSGHFHYHREEQTGGGKSWIQIPALDGGSAWYRQRAGDEALAGMMSLWLTPGKGIGYKNVTIHT